jgi:hypothetical protein
MMLRGGIHQFRSPTCSGVVAPLHRRCLLLAGSSAAPAREQAAEGFSPPIPAACSHPISMSACEIPCRSCPSTPARRCCMTHADSNIAEEKGGKNQNVTAFYIGEA